MVNPVLKSLVNVAQYSLALKALIDVTACHLAQQLDCSDFNSLILLMHLANLHLTAFSIGPKFHEIA